jgi:hypothetical protein
MEAFENLFGETGISIEEYTQSIDQIFTLLALFFLLIGIILLAFGLLGWLTLYCKRCLCTCLYGSFLSVFAFVIALLGAVLLAVVVLSKETINNYCAENWDDIPFGLGDSLQDSGYTPTDLDGLLNAPQNLLCSDLCPCPPEEEFKF